MKPETSANSNEFAGTQMFNVAELIDYEENAVAHRDIVKKSTGSVALLALDQGEVPKEHSAPIDALVQVLEGEAEFTISGLPHVLRSGEMILVPANHRHSVKAVERSRWCSRRSERMDWRPVLEHWKRCSGHW